jgi:hypothetical protein
MLLIKFDKCNVEHVDCVVLVNHPVFSFNYNNFRRNQKRSKHF